jgi:hypothetical protein
MRAIICPQCGAKIEKVLEGMIIGECGYCGTTVFFKDDKKPELEPGDRDTSRVPLEDYKPFDDYGRYPYEGAPFGKAYDPTIEEAASSLNETGIRVISIAAAICFGVFVVIIFGVVMTRKKPAEPVYPATRSVYSTPLTPAVTRPTAPSVTNADAVSLPAPALPKGSRVARKTQIQVYVTVDDKGNVYEAQSYEGSEPVKKAAIEAAYKAKFKSRTDQQWSSGVLVYDFGPK